MKKNAIIRLVVLAILLLNQALITLGYNPLPFSEEEIFTGVSTLATVVISVWAWWKNAPITKEAQNAQEILNTLKK